MTDESGGLLWLVAVGPVLLCVVSAELLPPGLALAVGGGVVSQGGGLYPPR